MRVDQLTGPALDWAVQQCEGQLTDIDFAWLWEDYSPSTNWVQAGVLIEREGLTITHQQNRWAAQTDDDLFAFGPTPLIAAMRCYVESVLGAEIDVPVEVTKGE
jgi:hypothetical protein